MIGIRQEVDYSRDDDDVYYNIVVKWSEIRDLYSIKSYLKSDILWAISDIIYEELKLNVFYILLFSSLFIVSIINTLCKCFW